MEILFTKWPKTIYQVCYSSPHPCPKVTKRFLRDLGRWVRRFWMPHIGKSRNCGVTGNRRDHPTVHLAGTLTVEDAESWSLSHVQLFYDPRDCSPSVSSVHGISQARILELVAISFFRGSSKLRDQIHISCIFTLSLINLQSWQFYVP